MNRKLILYIIYVVCIVVLLVVLFLIRSLTSQTSNISPAQTPPASSRLPQSPSDPLYGVEVVRTYPNDNQTNVPVNSQLTINLNRVITKDNVHYSIAPDISSTFTISGTSISILPSQLQQGAHYTVALQLSRLTDGSYRVFSYSFTTQGVTSTPIPPVNETLAPGVANSYQLQNDPDIFLSNHTPYSGSDFSISSSYNLPLHHYQFTVQATGSDPAQSKNDFISWAESLGLTSNQINGLDITYQ